MKLRVVVADDSLSFLETLVSILEIEFEVVKTAMDGTSALAMTINCQPDVVVLDLKMPGLTGMEVTRKLVMSSPRPAIVICSLGQNQEAIDAVLDAGALGYVFKAHVTRDLIAAVKSVARGETFVSAT